MKKSYGVREGSWMDEARAGSHGGREQRPTNCSYCATTSLHVSRNPQRIPSTSMIEYKLLNTSDIPVHLRGSMRSFRVFPRLSSWINELAEIGEES